MWSSVWTVSLLMALGWASDDFACRRPFYVKYASYGLFSYGLFTRNLLRRTAFPKTTNSTNETISSGDTAVPHTSPPFKVLHEKFNVEWGYSEMRSTNWGGDIQVEVRSEVSKKKSSMRRSKLGKVRCKVFKSSMISSNLEGYSGWGQIWSF